MKETKVHCICLEERLNFNFVQGPFFGALHGSLLTLCGNAQMPCVIWDLATRRAGLGPPVAAAPGNLLASAL